MKLSVSLNNQTNKKMETVESQKQLRKKIAEKDKIGSPVYYKKKMTMPNPSHMSKSGIKRGTRKIKTQIEKEPINLGPSQEYGRQKNPIHILGYRNAERKTANARMTTNVSSNRKNSENMEREKIEKIRQVESHNCSILSSEEPFDVVNCDSIPNRIRVQPVCSYRQKYSMRKIDKIREERSPKFRQMARRAHSKTQKIKILTRKDWKFYNSAEISVDEFCVKKISSSDIEMILKSIKLPSGIFESKRLIRANFKVKKQRFFILASRKKIEFYTKNGLYQSLKLAGLKKFTPFIELLKSEKSQLLALRTIYSYTVIQWSEMTNSFRARLMRYKNPYEIAQVGVKLAFQNSSFFEFFWTNSNRVFSCRRKVFEDPKGFSKMTGIIEVPIHDQNEAKCEILKIEIFKQKFVAILAKVSRLSAWKGKRLRKGGKKSEKGRNCPLGNQQFLDCDHDLKGVEHGGWVSEYHLSILGYDFHTKRVFKRSTVVLDFSKKEKKLAYLELGCTKIEHERPSLPQNHHLIPTPDSKNHKNMIFLPKKIQKKFGANKPKSFYYDSQTDNLLIFSRYGLISIKGFFLAKTLSFTFLSLFELAETQLEPLNNLRDLRFELGLILQNFGSEKLQDLKKGFKKINLKKEHNVISNTLLSLFTHNWSVETGQNDEMIFSIVPQYQGRFLTTATFKLSDFHEFIQPFLAKKLDKSITEKKSTKSILRLKAPMIGDNAHLIQSHLSFSGLKSNKFRTGIQKKNLEIQVNQSTKKPIKARRTLSYVSPVSKRTPLHARKFTTTFERARSVKVKKRKEKSKKVKNLFEIQAKMAQNIKIRRYWSSQKNYLIFQNGKLVDKSFFILKSVKLTQNGGKKSKKEPTSQKLKLVEIPDFVLKGMNKMDAREVDVTPVEILLFKGTSGGKDGVIGSDNEIEEFLKVELDAILFWANFDRSELKIDACLYISGQEEIELFKEPKKIEDPKSPKKVILFNTEVKKRPRSPKIDSLKLRTSIKSKKRSKIKNQKDETFYESRLKRCKFDLDSSPVYENFHQFAYFHKLKIFVIHLRTIKDSKLYFFSQKFDYISTKSLLKSIENYDDELWSEELGSCPKRTRNDLIELEELKLILLPSKSSIIHITKRTDIKMRTSIVITLQKLDFQISRNWQKLGTRVVRIIKLDQTLVLNPLFSSICDIENNYFSFLYKTGLKSEQEILVFDTSLRKIKARYCLKIREELLRMGGYELVCLEKSSIVLKRVESPTSPGLANQGLRRDYFIVFAGIGEVVRFKLSEDSQIRGSDFYIFSSRPTISMESTRPNKVEGSKKDAAGEVSDVRFISMLDFGRYGQEWLRGRKQRVGVKGAGRLRSRSASSSRNDYGGSSSRR